ncbi:hypothetical protein EDB81DRAFT_907685 [Dactylonectria macrodidyma]|uniref:Uncharacterized protein n=1 Tax=Dactylonectria macrodidyma TaxID=307937 RepID=A0A9P9DXX9_9HYPO|nr:hypothetical protein EDB81DRAFT_907685 [Dactylonectria macrodidyma]
MSFTMLLGLALAVLVPIVQPLTLFDTPGSGGLSGVYRDNPLYTVGEDMNILWNTDLDKTDLYVFLRYPTESPSHAYDVLKENSASTSMIWTVNLKNHFSWNFSEGDVAILYFGIFATGNNTVDGYSHYFNVTVPLSVTSTTSTNTATASVETTETELPITAVAGISVASTLGAVLMVGALAFLAWRRIHHKGELGALQTLQPLQTQHTPSEQGRPDELKTELSSDNWVRPPHVDQLVQNQEGLLSHETRNQPPHDEVRPQGPGGLYEAP